MQHLVLKLKECTVSQRETILVVNSIEDHIISKPDVLIIRESNVPLRLPKGTTSVLLVVDNEMDPGVFYKQVLPLMQMSSIRFHMVVEKDCIPLFFAQLMELKDKSGKTFFNVIKE